MTIGKSGGHNAANPLKLGDTSGKPNEKDSTKKKRPATTGVVIGATGPPYSRSAILEIQYLRKSNNGTESNQLETNFIERSAVFQRDEIIPKTAELQEANIPASTPPQHELKPTMGTYNRSHSSAKTASTTPDQEPSKGKSVLEKLQDIFPEKEHGKLAEDISKVINGTSPDANKRQKLIGIFKRPKTKLSAAQAEKVRLLFGKPTSKKKRSSSKTGPRSTIKRSSTTSGKKAKPKIESIGYTIKTATMNKLANSLSNKFTQEMPKDKEAVQQMINDIRAGNGGKVDISACKTGNPESTSNNISCLLELATSITKITQGEDSSIAKMLRAAVGKPIKTIPPSP